VSYLKFLRRYVRESVDLKLKLKNGISINFLLSKRQSISSKEMSITSVVRKYLEKRGRDIPSVP